MKNIALSPFIALLGAMMIWGSSFIALKYAFISYDSSWVIFWRLLVATLAFALFVKRMNLRAFRAKDIPALLVMALFEPCLYFVFESKALENTTASQAGMISSMLPLLVALLAAWLLNERLRGQMVVGFFVAMCGAIWLSVSGNSEPNAPNPLLGNLLEFIAMLCAGFFTVIVRRLGARYNAFFLTGFQSLCGAIFFAFIAFAIPLSEPLGRSEWHFGAGLAIVYLGVIVSFGGYGLYTYALSKIEASVAAGFVNLIPIFSLILGYLLLGERLNGTQFFGCILIFLGVIIALYRRRE